MAEFRDPIEIYREALQHLPQEENEPPRFVRVEAWPYPDLSRVWIRLLTTPFVRPPNLAIALYDPDRALISSMAVVEAREPYQSLVMHLRQAPRPGESYRLDIELARDGEVLDTRTVEFDLVFREPEQAGKEATGDDGLGAERDPGDGENGGHRGDVAQPGA